MDDEHTDGYREPCAQCSAVDWGVSDEGRFYCRSCHNAIERTREVVDSTFTPGSSRVSTISKGTRSKRTGSSSDWSPCSGSVDAVSYLLAQLRRSRRLMTMRKTLALIHLALIWSCEALTLSDLLRLVNEGHVPYVNAYEELPDEMKLEGKDALIFRVESVPSHHAVHQEAETLLHFLQLPAFPPISHQSLLHPALLSLRYLSDANLPDDLHLWVCRLMEHAGMEDQTLHTANSLSHPGLPLYDVQTAALIVVTMKLLFGLDDHIEWDLSNQMGDRDHSGDLFNLRRWYRLLQAALIRGQERRDQHIARKQWKANKLLVPSRTKKCVVMKKRRIAEQLQVCFEKLSSCPAGVERVHPSSFTFCWGDEDGADGPSLHQKKLDGVVCLKDGVLTPRTSSYWHPALRVCKPRRCRSHYSEVEATLPRSFVWLLQLFCFLLDVKPAYLYEEVLRVERRVFSSRTPSRRRTRTRADQDV